MAAPPSAPPLLPDHAHHHDREEDREAHQEGYGYACADLVCSDRTANDVKIHEKEYGGRVPEAYTQMELPPMLSRAIFTIVKDEERQAVSEEG